MDKIWRKLDTPIKIQDFLEKIPFNFEKRGETYMSPKKVLEENKAHCFEGALFAIACLNYHRQESYLLDLKTYDLKNDADHVVALFRQGGRWGAISKTNHSVLRFRDPIYKSVESLAYSYFHEYFLEDGRKSLLSYSKPFNVFRKFGKGWVNSSEDLDQIAIALDGAKHYNFYDRKSRKFIRRASALEVKAFGEEEFKK